MILLNVQNASVEALKYMNTFKMYEYIWLEEKESYLERFLHECEEKCLADNDCSTDMVHEPDSKIDLFQTQVSYHFTFFFYFLYKNKINNWLRYFFYFYVLENG